MDDIRIDVGVYTALEVDLSNFDFTGISKVVLTVKNFPGTSAAFTREFTTAAVHDVVVTPSESNLLTSNAEYDFDIVTTDGKCYKNGSNGNIVLRKGCGVCSGSA